MDNFKLITRQKGRFQSSKGQLSTEQLWDVDVEDLNDIAVSLDEQFEKSGKKSFIEEVSEKDMLVKLKLDVVLEILQIKLAERKAAKEAAANLKHNKKIIAAISEKKDEALKSKSVEELESMLKAGINVKLI